MQLGRSTIWRQWALSSYNQYVADMMMNMFRMMTGNIKPVLAAVAVGLAAVAPQAGACTRVVYQGEDSLFVVGRSLDWKTPIPTNLYVYPRGMEKAGDVREGAKRWVSRYGAVYAVSYDGGVTEGMNEAGLVINGLFCKGTVYGNAQTAGRPPMSLAVFVAWLLDTHATTEECVDTLRSHDFDISGATFDGGTVSALHWGITDASGRTAILEFDHGEVRIHYPGDILAMTNDPQWGEMKAVLEYWDKVGGANFLPGAVRSPDRCARANFFAHNVERTADGRTAVAITRSVLACSSVPYRYTLSGEPNLSSTQWRSFADTKNRRYYFDIVTGDGMYFVDLKRCDLRPGSPVLKLDTSRHAHDCGDATRWLEVSAPFTPMY